MFGPWGGMSIPNLKQKIGEWACSVAAAPVKPLQALEIWSDTILPRIKANPSLALLKSLDTQICGHVKSLLHLLDQILNVMIYVKTRNGGLGITCLEDAIPDLTIRGLHKLCWKTKSEMIKKLAQGLGVRDMLEDLCKRYHLCRLAELGRKEKKRRKKIHQGTGQSLRTSGVSTWPTRRLKEWDPQCG